MPDLTLEDVTLHYEISGDGPPLLMIAGMLSDSASWAPLVPLLEPHFTLIRPDNRNTGRTTPADIWSSFLGVVENCTDLMKHLGHPSYHILGHSMGGLIGTQVAHFYPHAVASLTLAASAPVHLKRNVALFQTLVDIRQSDAPPDTWLRALLPWLFNTSRFEDPDTIDQAVQAALDYPHAQTVQAMQSQVLALHAFEARATTRSPHVPTLAVLAENDLLLPLDIARTAHKETPVVVVTGAGHSVHWDAPDAVATHLLSHTRAHPIQRTSQ